MKKISIIILGILLLTSCNNINSNSETETEKNETGKNKIEKIETGNIVPVSIETDNKDFDTGYKWAEKNNTSNAEDCNENFKDGPGGNIRGCIEYVENNIEDIEKFEGKQVSEDYKYGYEWAERIKIKNANECSKDFSDSGSGTLNGCLKFVEDNK